MKKLLRNKPILLCIPVLLYLGLFFLGGIINGVWVSTKSGVQRGDPFASYRIILGDGSFYDGLKLSFSIAGVSTVCSVVIGTILIYILYSTISSQGLEKTVLYKRAIEIPMLFPYIVAALMITMLFQKSGVIASISYRLGWITATEQFPTLINDRRGIGIILTYVWKLSPFVVIMVYPKLMKIEKEWNDLKMVIGANNKEFFRHIVFPMIRRELILCGFIIFAFTFSEFEVPYILGVTYPKTLSVYSYSLFINGDFTSKPIAIGMNLILSLITLLIGVAGFIILSRRKSYEKL